MYLFIYLLICLLIYYFIRVSKTTESRWEPLQLYLEQRKLSSRNSAYNASKNLSYSDMARRFNLRNKKGNFYKYSLGTLENLRSYLYPGMRSSFGKHFIFSQQYKSGKIILEVVHAFRFQAVRFFSSKLFAVLFLHNTLLRNRATHEPNRRYSKMQFWI